MDEDLRELERLARAAPADALLAVRLARALVRAGELGRAVLELARAVDAGARDALGELDLLTRGGVDPLAPWPAPRGDGRNSARSIASGPLQGAIVERRKLLDWTPVRDFCVDAKGEPWTVTLPGVHVQRSMLLAGSRVAASSDDRLFVLADGDAPRQVHPFKGPWIAGLGLLVAPVGARGLETRRLFEGGPGTRWPLPRGVAALAFAPGAKVLALSKAGVGGRGSLHRFDLASGRALATTWIDPIGLERDEGTIVVAPDGATYLGIGGALLALDEEGATLFRRDGVLVPAALAGESGDVLVACDPRSLRPIALDRRTGRELWRSADQCLNGLPRIDARGLVYWRREQELVAFDPLTGELVLNAVVGDRYWDFAFTGQGRVACLRSVSPGVGELIVVE